MNSKKKAIIKEMVDSACGDLRKEMLSKMRAANATFHKMRAELLQSIDECRRTCELAHLKIEKMPSVNSRVIAIADWLHDSGFDPETFAALCRKWNERLEKLEKANSPAKPKRKNVKQVISKEDIAIINNPRHRHMENTNGTTIQQPSRD